MYRSGLSTDQGAVHTSERKGNFPLPIGIVIQVKLTATLYRIGIQGRNSQVHPVHPNIYEMMYGRHSVKIGLSQAIVRYPGVGMNIFESIIMRFLAGPRAVNPGKCLEIKSIRRPLDGEIVIV